MFKTTVMSFVVRQTWLALCKTSDTGDLVTSYVGTVPVFQHTLQSPASEQLQGWRGKQTNIQSQSGNKCWEVLCCTFQWKGAVWLYRGKEVNEDFILSLHPSSCFVLANIHAHHPHILWEDIIRVNSFNCEDKYKQNVWLHIIPYNPSS